MLVRSAGAAVFLAFVWGCTGAATFTMRDGSTVRARIVRSDAVTVWVEGPHTGTIDPEDAPDLAGHPIAVVPSDAEAPVAAGLLGADTRVGPSSDYSGRRQWQRVCIEEAGGSTRCLPGDQVASVEVQPRALRREEIVDVSHPGLGEMGAGIAMLGVSAVLVGTLVGRSDRSSCSGGCFDGVVEGLGALAIGIPGLVFAIDGPATYFGSQSRYAPPEAPGAPMPSRRDTVIRIVP